MCIYKCVYGVFLNFTINLLKKVFIVIGTINFIL